MIRFKAIYLIAVLMLVGMCGVSFGAVSTGATGQTMMVFIDETQLDALGADPVLYYNSTTRRVEGNDAIGAAGGLLGAGTADGQIPYWDVAGGIWTPTNVANMWWDATNLSLGIGANSATSTPTSYLVVRDDTLDTTTSYSGVYSRLIKTAGVTDADDDIRGVDGNVTMNDADSTIGELVGFGGYATVTACTLVASAYGVDTELLISDDVTNAYGIKSNAQMSAGTVVALTGADIRTQPVTVTANAIGIKNDLDVNGGSALNYIGFLNVGTYDNCAGGDDILGISNSITVSAGMFTLTDDLYGISNSISLADDIGDDVVGVKHWINQTAGTIAGDGTGVLVDCNFGGTVTGTTVGVDVTSDANLDIAFRQAGTTVKPFVGLVLADGINVDVAIGNGTNFLVNTPLNAFSISGITGGIDGRMITIYNPINRNMTISNEDVGSVAANRITTTTGGGMATTAAGCVSLIYDGVTSRWLLIDMEV